MARKKNFCLVTNPLKKLKYIMFTDEQYYSFKDNKKLSPYAISNNRQAAISLLEVLRLAKRDLRVAPEHRKERKKARILSNQQFNDRLIYVSRKGINNSPLTFDLSPLTYKRMRTTLQTSSIPLSTLSLV